MATMTVSPDRPIPSRPRGHKGGPAMSPETIAFLGTVNGGCVRLMTDNHNEIHMMRARFNGVAKSRGLRVRQTKDRGTGDMCFWAEKK